MYWQRYFSSVASGIHRGVISMSEVALASSSPPDTIRRNSSADEDGQIGHNAAEVCTTIHVSRCLRLKRDGLGRCLKCNSAK